MRKRNKKKDPELISALGLTVAALAALCVQICWETENPAKTVVVCVLLAAGALFFFLYPLFLYRNEHGNRADRLRLLFSDEAITVSITCNVSEKRLGTLAPDKKAFSVCMYERIENEVLLRAHTLTAQKADTKKANDAFRGEVKINLNDLLTLHDKTVIIEEDAYAAMQAFELYQPLFTNNTVVPYNVLGEEQG